ncbi:MAG: DNA methyltransferase [Caldilineaceae bacterium]
MNQLNRDRARRLLQSFRFDDLFIDELGWDHYTAAISVTITVASEQNTFTLQALAEKRGMTVLHCATLPDYQQRRAIEREVAKLHHENIVIYSDRTQNRQIWQWVRRETGKPLANRERRWEAGQSGEPILQLLAGIGFGLDEEADLTVIDVTSRVRAAFDVERVTKKFYAVFKSQHDRFLKFIEGIPDDDLRRWYASVMLNRIMFIYFIQKKGFLDNDLNYLANRLQRYMTNPTPTLPASEEGDHGSSPRVPTGRGGGWEGVNNFYRDFLCPLFFQGFAQKEHGADVRALLGDVPYLNGGLFLKHQIEERHGNTIAIANAAFAELFAFFDQYQWHLDERPLRADDEINPDVLGYIFEKYINQKQMGAYYTKEDITEYIAKNTIIPYLFDAMQKADSVPFSGDNAIWHLLAHDPDRYIYRAVAKGMTWSTDNGGNEVALAEPLSLPPNIAAGVDDVAARGDWNTPTPPSHGLPTEIWRETVARRQRYTNLKQKLATGEVRAINDLITLNLDIVQFAQDVLDATDSPDLIRAAWQALNRMTVLDPTCGSGAFLFAALNILEPLYEACLNRMESFVAELEQHAQATGTRPHPQKLRDFRDELAAMAQHPNRRYFTLKRIMVNNLYGVDIMEEAVEICKLRLFLKLVAQVAQKAQIEPLPDIDFNIRAGNTLVGFATQEDISRALEYDASRQGSSGETQMTMLYGEDQAALDEIKRKAGDVERLFALFRQQQTSLGGEVSAADKAELRRRLGLLSDELNRLLARQYGKDPAKLEYEEWLESHKPFHWFVEFYGVLQGGGFDVIIGNPPWKEYTAVRKSYTVKNYTTEKAGNLYCLSIERSLQLRALNGSHSFIVQLPLVSSSRMESVRNLLKEKSNALYVIPFDDRPGKLFAGLQHCRSSIYFSIGKGLSSTTNYQTSGYQRWYTEIRERLFAEIKYVEVNPIPPYIQHNLQNIQDVKKGLSLAS